MVEDTMLEMKLAQLNVAKNLLLKRGGGEEIKSSIEYLVEEIEDLLKDNEYIRAIEVQKFTLKELSMYTGENEKLAYIAISGTVYDITGVKHWTNGKHYGVSAGKDLTSEFQNCHGGDVKKLERLRIVGVLIQ